MCLNKEENKNNKKTLEQTKKKQGIVKKKKAGFKTSKLKENKVWFFLLFLI